MDKKLLVLYCDVTVATRIFNTRGFITRATKRLIMSSCTLMNEGIVLFSHDIVRIHHHLILVPSSFSLNNMYPSNHFPSCFPLYKWHFSECRSLNSLSTDVTFGLDGTELTGLSGVNWRAIQVSLTRCFVNPIRPFLLSLFLPRYLHNNKRLVMMLTSNQQYGE